MPRSKSCLGWMVVPVLWLVFSTPNIEAKESDTSYDLSRMEAFSWVLLQLKQDYVDPSRIHPAKMMKRILELIERYASEVEIKLTGGLADVQVESERKSFQVGEPATVWEMNYNLQPVFEFIGKNLEPTTDRKEVEFAAINGMLSTLDPHSNLLPPELFQEMQLKTVGEFGGLGIRITVRKDALTVISPLPDTPASRMGLKAMDQIVRIGDQSTVNMPLDEAVSMLRGPPGSKVSIWVMRQGWSEPHKYVMTREIIRVRSIESKLLDSQIGYIQVQDFGKHTAGDFLRHLSEMKRSAKGLKGLILDLRNNAGGLMKAAVDLADLFLDHGIIVATVSYSEDSTEENKIQKSREEKRAEGDDVEKDLPVVVLVNSGSASASEILAGALKNLDRAVLMGEQTFGKGTVQILNERVPDSIKGACLKLTVAEYLIPGDISIQEVGVTPDIQLVPMKLEKKEIQAFAQRDRFREEDIPAHLRKREAAKLQPSEIVHYVTEPSKEDPTTEEEPPLNDFEFKEDFEIKLAKDFLLHVKAIKGSTMLDEGAAFIREVEQGEQQKMEKRMGELGIDWSSGASDDARAEFEFKIEGEGADASGQAMADHEVILSLQVRNTGAKPFFRLRAESECDYWLYDKREFLFGRVDPGKTRTWKVPIKISRGAMSRIDDIRFSFFCDGGTPPPPMNTFISTKGLSIPAFGYSYKILDPEGNGDGLIQPGEKVEMELTVVNQGQGKAFDAKAMLKNEAGVDLFLEAGKGRVTLKEILPGQSRKSSFVFRVPETTTRTDLPVELTIWDADLGISQTERILLPVFTKDQSPVLNKIKTGLSVKVPRAEIRSGAEGKMPLVGFVKKGTTFLSNLRAGPWYRIDGKGGPAGWIHQESITEISAKGARPFDARNLLTFVQVTPPKITLDKIPLYQKEGEAVVIKGTIQDEDSDVRDVAVWSGEEKVFLQSGAKMSNPRLVPLEVKIKLKAGANVITVVAREGTKYAVQESLVITRPGGLEQKKNRGLEQEEDDKVLILE